MAYSRRKGDRSHGVDGSGALGRRLGGGESLEKSLCGGCVAVEHGDHGWNLLGWFEKRYEVVFVVVVIVIIEVVVAVVAVVVVLCCVLC